MERKHLIFIIVTIFALSVSGCGATEIDEKPSVKKEVQKESKTENKKRDEKETLFDADIWGGTHKTHKISFHKNIRNVVYEGRDNSSLIEKVNL